MLVRYHEISINYHADTATKWTCAELHVHNKARSQKVSTNDGTSPLNKSIEEYTRGDSAFYCLPGGEREVLYKVLYREVVPLGKSPSPFPYH